MNKRDLTLQETANEFELIIEDWRSKGFSLLEIVGLLESFKHDILELIVEDPTQIYSTPTSPISS